MVRQTQEDILRTTMVEAMEYKRLMQEDKKGEALEIIKKGKWTVAMNGQVLVKGLVEIRKNEKHDYDIYIVGHKVWVPF